MKIFFVKSKIFLGCLTLCLFSTTSANDFFAGDLDVTHESIGAPVLEGLQSMSDEGLGDVQGQALLDFSQQVNSDGIQFLRLLINARLDANLNIKELKLGDRDGSSLTPDDPQIWLRDVSLSGGTGPDSYATLIRPFVEIAMRNYDDEQNRELIGLRVAFEDSSGIFGVGDNDTSPECIQNGGTFCDDYGVEAFHGYFDIGVDDNPQATVNIGELKLADYLQSRGEEVFFCNGTDPVTGACVGDLYIPGDPSNGGAAYEIEYQNFSGASNPDNFAIDHVFNNVLWSGFCDTGNPDDCRNNVPGANWVVRLDDGDPFEHLGAGNGVFASPDIDATIDATGTCFVCADAAEYGVRPGQVNDTADIGDSFSAAASTATVQLESERPFNGQYIRGDANSEKLNLIATGEFAPINYIDQQGTNDIPPDTRLDDIEQFMADNPNQTRYINGVEFDLGDGLELVTVFDTQLGEIFVDGTAALEYADVLLPGLVDLIIPRVRIAGRVEGVGIDTRISEDIRFAHAFNISSENGLSGLSLSLQSEDIHYPGTLPDNIARAGVWLGLESPVNLGDLGVLPKTIYLSDLEYRQIEAAVEKGLLQGTNLDLLQAAFAQANIGFVDVDTTILLEVNDIPLGAQQAPPVNCYGGVDCF